MTTSAARTATVPISQGSKRAIHCAARCQVKSRLGIPGTDTPANFTSVTILSDLVLIAARWPTGALLPTLVGWKGESISSRRHVGLRRFFERYPVESP